MSRFSKALAGLIDGSGIMNRAEWAEFLSVDEKSAAQAAQDIDDWLSDRVLPDNSKLHMIYDVVACAGSPFLVGDHKCPPHVKSLHDMQKASAGVLEEFSLMEMELSVNVSPLGSRMLPTVHDYRIRGLFGEVTSKLAKLSEEEKVAFLVARYIDGAKAKGLDPDDYNPEWTRPADWKYKQDWNSPSWRRLILEGERDSARRTQKYGFVRCPKCDTAHTRATCACRGCDYKVDWKALLDEYRDLTGNDRPGFMK